MRLIDADVLIEWIDAGHLRNPNELCFSEADVVEMIDHMPTIEPKKGKWIEDAETFYKTVNEKGGGVDADTPYFTEDDIACSECLSLFSVIDNCTECFDYCPNCGADMREGEQDG